MEIVFWMWASETDNKQNNFQSRQYRAYSREHLEICLRGLAREDQCLS